jgi:radical SAM superfamily enzyme YgiQ (UPF0313 family)
MDRNLVAIGFRRVLSYARSCGFSVTGIYFLDNAWGPSLSGSWLKQKTGENFKVNYVNNDEAICCFAERVADADVIAFSLMSVQRNIVKKIYAAVKARNPKVKVIIGGYHSTICAEDAIAYADAICLGEGEKAFVELLRRIEVQGSLKGVCNTWVKENGELIKNPAGPLMTTTELESMPFMEYGIEDQHLFSFAHGKIKTLTKEDVIRQVGTTYNTIWSVGCPNRCTFCCQSRFIDFNKEYAHYRGPSPEYIIREIKQAMQSFPIDYVIFYDSNFLGRDMASLREFAEKYKREIGLKFILSGTNPLSVTEERLRLLIDAGLVRIKMGVEAGNDTTLKLFNRPAMTANIRAAAEAVWQVRKRMVVPAFEMIIDNPYESVECLYQTVDFLNSLPHYYTVSLFSFQFMPGTDLSKRVDQQELLEEHMDKEYMFSYSPTLLNIVLSVFAIGNPPQWCIRLLKRMIKGKETKKNFFLKDILYKTMLFRRACNQARFGDYSTFPTWVMLFYHAWHQFWKKLKPKGAIKHVAGT